MATGLRIRRAEEQYPNNPGGVSGAILDRWASQASAAAGFASLLASVLRAVILPRQSFYPGNQNDPVTGRDNPVTGQNDPVTGDLF
ncbi:hypothetical protein BVG19_g487 [[Candida] boidinii]|nr:hypothetical protein BVG19_g487 [[Candida] boidinii]OWB50280.1 hypothetical protein B5S27_g1828 [[Candida] boidinii]